MMGGCDAVVMSIDGVGRWNLITVAAPQVEDVAAPAYGRRPTDLHALAEMGLPHSSSIEDAIGHDWIATPALPERWDAKDQGGFELVRAALRIEGRRCHEEPVQGEIEEAGEKNPHHARYPF